MAKKFTRRSGPRTLVRSGGAGTPATSATPPNSMLAHHAAFLEPGKRAAMVAECAYFRAERRGFDPGHELEDWLAAETDVDRALLETSTLTPCGGPFQMEGAPE